MQSDQYSILNHISDSVLIIDRDYSIIFANQQFLEFSGTSSEETIGKKCYQLLHNSPFPCAEQSGADNTCSHRQVFETGLAACHVHQHMMPDGSKRFLEVSASPIKDETGVVVRVMNIIRDDTAKDELQEALFNSEQRFRELFNNMSSGVAIYQAVDNGNDFIFKDMNPAGLKDGRVERENVLNRSVKEVFPGVVELGLFDVLQRVWKTGQPEHHPASVYTDDRIQLWVENYVCKLSSGEIVAIYKDITKRKQIELSLIRAKEEWQKSFDSIPDIVTIQNKDMRIVRANKAAHDFFELGGDENLVGKCCYEVFRGITEPCGGCPLVETLGDVGDHSEIIQHVNLGKTFLVTSSPILDQDKKIQLIVHMAKDITEQKRLEEELFQAHKLEAIGTLAGGIAHDFNNILCAIVGFAQLGKLEVENNTPAAHDLDQVLLASKRATGLVKQLLSFSRKGAQKREVFQPYLIVKEALKMMRASLPSTMEIKEDIDPESGSIFADPTKIHQIIVNLCTNALHAMEEETGILRVALVRQELRDADVSGHPGVSPGQFLKLSISDNGCGMDKETQRRIFEPYFSTKGAGKGTGLGLAVILGVVQDYGGMITIDTAVGEGTTFHIYFPAIIEETEKNEGAAGDERALLTGTERILTVDDERSIVELHESILSRLGYSVTAKKSSEEALATFKSDPQSFDLLITDQTMPALSGAKLAQEVLRIRPDMPIILCTGYSSTLSEERAKSMGIKRYLNKPVDRKELVRVVRAVLDEV